MSLEEIFSRFSGSLIVSMNERLENERGKCSTIDPGQIRAWLDSFESTLMANDSFCSPLNRNQRRHHFFLFTETKNFDFLYDADFSVSLFLSRYVRLFAC